MIASLGEYWHLDRLGPFSKVDLTAPKCRAADMTGPVEMDYGCQ